MPNELQELLTRHCDEGRGTKVINCVVHMGTNLTERPTGCQLCAGDTQNQLRLAIAINAWLNQWKDDAEAILKDPKRAAAPELYEKLENLLASITAYCAGKPPELLPLSVFGKPIVEAIGALRRANPSRGESPDAK